jgi:hypothetical protein
LRLVVTKRNYDAVNTRAGIAPGGEILPDSYRERLVKYIPVETIAVFVAVYGITYYLSGSEPWYPVLARWILIVCILGTVIYLWKVEGVADPVQLSISTLGFVVWIFSLGVISVTSLPGYNAIAAGLLLPVYIFGSPLIEGIPEQW